MSCVANSDVLDRAAQATTRRDGLGSMECIFAADFLFVQIVRKRVHCCLITLDHSREVTAGLMQALNVDSFEKKTVTITIKR